MRGLLYCFRALAAEVVDVVDGSIPVHDPVIATDAVTFIFIRP